MESLLNYRYPWKRNQFSQGDKAEILKESYFMGKKKNIPLFKPLFVLNFCYIELTLILNDKLLCVSLTVSLY